LFDIASSPIAVDFAKEFARQRGNVKTVESSHVTENVVTVRVTFEKNDDVLNGILLKVEGKWQLYTILPETSLPESAVLDIARRLASEGAESEDTPEEVSQEE